jgi:UDP-N-acetylenolpyruvoylglucosamine reductase
MNVNEQLKQLFPDIIENEPMSSHTTYRIGGPADLFLYCKSSEMLCDVIIKAREFHIPITILGSGSNVLVFDKGIRGIVIKNAASKISIRGMKGKISKGIMEKSVIVDVECGCMMNTLVRHTIEEGLSGLEWHLGLPGTVGGALFMNSKWTKPESHFVGDCVKEAVILTKNSKIKTVNKDYFHFGYDQSILQSSGDIVLTVAFELHEEQKELLWQKAQESMGHRKESQPMGVSTAGCTFRNISKIEALTGKVPDGIQSAGYLIDSVGLKGYTIGGAQFSLVHANFIVNIGGAKAVDMVQLINLAKEKVYSQYNIRLNEEIVFLGEK